MARRHRTFEPASERMRRGTVVAVVRFDHDLLVFTDTFRLREFKASLHACQRAVGIRQVDGALETVELFKLLDGIALNAGAQRVPHDRIEVDEQLGAEHPVDLFFPRCIPPHEALERSGLVRREVIDVEAWVLPPTLYYPSP